MYSNLTKTNYEIKDMTLSTLRDRIIMENNLTPLDILKGFHAKSKIDMRYESVLTEQNLKDIKTIEDEYERYFLNEIQNNIQKWYDEKFNQLFENYKKDYTEFSIEDVVYYKNEKNTNQSVLIQNLCSKFLRELGRIKQNFKYRIEDDAKEYIKSYIKENFGENYKVTAKSPYGGFEGLPYNLEVNSPIDINFSAVYELYKDYGGEFDDWITLNYDSHINEDYEIDFSKYDMIKISAHISEEKAKEVFNNAINSVIYQNNSVGELEFFQNLESQPITININTKTNKYELIDGYRRLLYITDEKLLSYSAPIKIFTDLNDTQFLSLLYASNAWKSKESFHDRGFLFALKTRFNFVIPLSAYNVEHYWNELSTLQLYDFGGNLVRVDYNRLMDTLLNHKFLASDINLMYNFLPQESEKYGYDKNMADEIKFTIIELVGEARRAKDNDLQNELSESLITSIFADDLIKQYCSKKHLSTRTYVINYFRDKGLYKHITDILKKNLIKE